MLYNADINDIKLHENKWQASNSLVKVIHDSPRIT